MEMEVEMEQIERMKITPEMVIIEHAQPVNYINDQTHHQNHFAFT